MGDAGVAACIERGEVDAFLGYLEAEWRASSKHFKHVQRKLLDAVERGQVPPETFLAFACRCISALIGRPPSPRAPQPPAEGSSPTQQQAAFDKWDSPPPAGDRDNPWKPTNAPMTGTDAALCHLLLETASELSAGGGGAAAAASGEGVQQAAAELFNTCLGRRNARLAVKVAACFALGARGSGSGSGVDRALLVASVQQLLSSQQLLGPAVSLLTQFPGLSLEFDPLSVMLALAADGQLPVAQKWATELGHEAQTGLVHALVGEGNLRDACKLMTAWHFEAQFPNLEADYRQRTLDRLLGKGLWGAAAGMAIGNPGFQRQLVTELAVQGEAALAAAYCAQFGLDAGGLPLDGAQLARSRAAREAQFHRLALPPGAVVFVDSPQAVAEAGKRLRSAGMLAMDVEWRPDVVGAKSPASILQVACDDCAFIFDLIALNGEPALDALLCALLRSRAAVKLGMDAGQDLKRLAGSYPGMAAFREVRRLLDVSHLWRLWAELPGSGGEGRQPPLPLSRKRQQVGLSAIAEAVLGQPLDKSMQMSDWARRPLTPLQTRYAALDAYVMLEIWRTVRAAAGEAAEQLLERACTDVVRGPAAGGSSSNAIPAPVRPQLPSRGGRGVGRLMQGRPAGQERAGVRCWAAVGSPCSRSRAQARPRAEGAPSVARCEGRSASHGCCRAAAERPETCSSRARRCAGAGGRRAPAAPGELPLPGRSGAEGGPGRELPAARAAAARLRRGRLPAAGRLAARLRHGLLDTGPGRAGGLPPLGCCCAAAAQAGRRRRQAGSTCGAGCLPLPAAGCLGCIRVWNAH